MTDVQHNFPIGAVLDDGAYDDWIVRPRTTNDSPGNIPVEWIDDGGATQQGEIGPEDVKRVVSLPAPIESKAPTAESFNLDVAKLAVRHSRKIGFSYTKPNGDYSDRVLAIEGVLEGSKGTLLVGHDAEANDFRAFRLDRIDGEVELY